MATNPTLLSMPIAQNGQKNVIPETQATAGDGLFSQSTGFPAETSLPLGAGGVAPSREDFNGLANLLGGVAFYAQKGWQFQFDAAQDYYAGCIVRDTTDGKLYECINDVAAGGSVPSADAGNWKEYGVDPSIVANTNLSNLTATGEARFAHVVVDSYYDSTTGDWWRQYADGWVEQGGRYKYIDSSTVTINLLKPMTDNMYNITRCNGAGSTVGGYTGSIAEEFFGVYNLTTTNFVVNVTGAANYHSSCMAWSVSGMGANS